MLYFLTGRPPDSSLTGADFLPLLDWSCLSVLPSMLAVLSHGGVWRTEGSDGRYTVRPTTRLSASPAIVGHNHQDTTRNKQETDCRLGGGGRWSHPHLKPPPPPPSSLNCSVQLSSSYSRLAAPPPLPRLPANPASALLSH